MATPLPILVSGVLAVANSKAALPSLQCPARLLILIRDHVTRR